MSSSNGIVFRVNGPVVQAKQVTDINMREQVEVGELRLIGEVIELEGDVATIQVYEDTTGMKPGEPIYGTGAPLSVELGPGLLGNTFDGLQRPLEAIREESGSFIARGIRVPYLDKEKKWRFQPRVQVGDAVKHNSIIGVVQETELIEHRIIVPPRIEGEISFIAEPGEYNVEKVVAKVKTSDGEKELKMYHLWSVRIGRPYPNRLSASLPLVTGQRVLDFFFPLAKGGTAAIPGGFGAGKTVLQHQLAKWSDADIIIYIGCGERGNEMTQVLEEFPGLIDPKSGRPLMERTILIANTSNMPVTARETSIYTGITLGEYYRDMGYDVALMADSTSRWAEALREISGRLEEMPAEEGYPAYLPSRLAEFYERAGRVLAYEEREASITVVGAVSPPGGDFSEPVTQHTKRFIRCFWALDKELAAARHFPAVSWIDSYSEYTDDIESWWQEEFDFSWEENRGRAMELFQTEQELQHIVKLIGPDALPDNQRLILETVRIIKEAFLEQNALSEEDTYCSIEKQIAMFKAIMHFYDRAQAIIDRGAPIFTIMELGCIEDIMRMKTRIPNDQVEKFEEVMQTIDSHMDRLESRYQ